jgi:DNA polymerase Ligase (LigD)
MPRFVLLYHDCPQSFGKPSHWDLMLEFEGVLMTWSLTELPSAWQTSSAPDNADPRFDLQATRIADHRLAYLDYEGPVSNNRGEVRRQDRGEYEITKETDDRLEVKLRGKCIRGVVTLPIGPTKSAPG